MKKVRTFFKKNLSINRFGKVEYTLELYDSECNMNLKSS